MYAIKEVANRIVGMDVEEIFADIGAFWSFRTFTPMGPADSDSGWRPAAPMAGA
jgi:hypothetical protein